MKSSKVAATILLSAVTLMTNACSDTSGSANALATEGEGGKVPADSRFSALFTQIKGLDYIARGFPKTAAFKDASGNELVTFTNTFDDKKRIVSQSYTLPSGTTETDLQSTTGAFFFAQSPAYASFGLFAAYRYGNSSKSGSRTYSAAGTGCPEWLENAEEVAGENTVSTAYTCDGTKIASTQVRLENQSSSSQIKYTNTSEMEFDANFVVPLKTSGTWNSESGNNGTFSSLSTSTNSSEYTFTDDKVTGYKAENSGSGTSIPSTSSTRECTLADTDLSCNISSTSGTTTSTSTSVVSLQANRVWPWFNGFLTQITKSTTVTGGSPMPPNEFDEKGRSAVMVTSITSQDGSKSYRYFTLEYPDASSLKATKMTVLGNDKATVQATVEFTWE